MKGEPKNHRELFQKINDVLVRRYWNRLAWFENQPLSSDKVCKPVHEVFDYVLSAIKMGLDKRSETAYCGSLFLYSVLRETQRRFTSDVNEANELHEVGKELALFLWNSIEKESSENDLVNLTARIEELKSEISDYLWNEFSKIRFRRLEGQNE